MASLSWGVSEWPRDAVREGRGRGLLGWGPARRSSTSLQSEGPWPLSLFPVNGASELLSDSGGTGPGPGHGGPGSKPPEDQHEVNTSDPRTRPQALSPSAPPWRKQRGGEGTLRSSAEEGSLWGGVLAPMVSPIGKKVRAPPEGSKGGGTLTFRCLTVLHGGRGAHRASCANRTPTVCRTPGALSSTGSDACSQECPAACGTLLGGSGPQKQARWLALPGKPPFLPPPVPRPRLPISVEVGRQGSEESSQTSPQAQPAVRKDQCQMLCFFHRTRGRREVTGKRLTRPGPRRSHHGGGMRGRSPARWLQGGVMCQPGCCEGLGSPGDRPAAHKPLPTPTHDGLRVDFPGGSLSPSASA